MLDSIPGVEKTRNDGDEDIVVFTRQISDQCFTAAVLLFRPFQESIPVSVDGIDSLRVKDRNMVWLNSDQLAMLLVCLVDGFIPSATACLPEEP
jgi:hypothetical protein